MLLGKIAAPQAAHVVLHHSILSEATESRLTLFNAPAGYLCTDSLSAVLKEHGRPILWLRLGPEDADPAGFLVSLIASAQKLYPTVGLMTLEQMRRQPGPMAGWPPLFACLGRELARGLPESAAIVLEHVHYLDDSRPTLELLGTHLLPALPPNLACILIAHRRMPSVLWPAHAILWSASDLRLSARAVAALFKHNTDSLPAMCLDRATALTESRAEVLAGLCTEARTTLTRQVIERAANLDDLLARMVRVCLASATTDARQALALGAHLEYLHPALIQATLGDAKSSTGLWLQSLDDDWSRVRCVWQAPLRAALRGRPSLATLHRAADYLVNHAAIEQAVPLYCEAQDMVGAAQAIAQAADAMMNLGKWQTLGHWLDHLPAETLNDWPRLVCIKGELAAAYGQVEAARRAFAAAAALFVADHNADGACQSMLSESALAAWQGDYAHAQARAQAASDMAQAAGLASHPAWATWQLGCVAALSGDLEKASAYFGLAATATNDPTVAEALNSIQMLAQREHELRTQCEHHLRAYRAAEHAERETYERLHQSLSTPTENLSALLNTFGWTRTPLMLKLPMPSPSAQSPDSLKSTSLFNRLLQAVGLRRQPQSASTTDLVEKTNLPAPHRPLPAESGAVAREPLAASTWNGNVQTANEMLPILPGQTSDLTPIIEVAPPETAAALNTDKSNQKSTSASDATVATVQMPTLTAHLLGAFRVAVNDQPVGTWPSGRGRAVLKYLLVHHDQPAPRDVLMDVFWPDASPEAARNRLHVALHNLRQKLRTVTDMPVVIFEDGAYGLNPDFHLWVDADEFDRHVETGHRLEAAGQITKATAEYELAIGLYQDDLLADDPYEEWPVLMRERLRVAYLDTLDRVSHIYFDQGQYAACETLCQLILARDNCREDAHCLLMRCYCRQGQYHLALRQYQICVEVLRAELEVDPAPETTQLYDHIRHRKPV